jgi:hypothetical protein
MFLVLSTYEKISFLFFRHCEDNSPKQSYIEKLVIARELARSNLVIVIWKILLRLLRFARNDGREENVIHLNYSETRIDLVNIFIVVSVPTCPV